MLPFQVVLARHGVEDGGEVLGVLGAMREELGDGLGVGLGVLDELLCRVFYRRKTTGIVLEFRVDGL